MVTVKGLFHARYKFKHIKVELLEKDDNDNVLAFSASFVKTALPDQISEGHKEINKTLWDQESTKRPKGYWLLDNIEKDGVMTSFFVADEWLERPKTEKEKQKVEWGILRK